MSLKVHIFWEGHKILRNLPLTFDYSKVHMFWEGHKIWRNIPLTFDGMYCSQKLGEDFAKFCGLLRIYELYIKSKVRGRFCKILWPSQNKWTLWMSPKAKRQIHTQPSKVEMFQTSWAQGDWLWRTFRCAVCT